MRDDVPEKRVAFFFVRRVRVFARSAVKLPVAAACRALFGRALRASKRFIDIRDDTSDTSALELGSERLKSPSDGGVDATREVRFERIFFGSFPSFPRRAV